MIKVKQMCKIKKLKETITVMVDVYDGDTKYITGTPEFVNEEMERYDDAHSNCYFYNEKGERIIGIDWDGCCLTFETDGVRYGNYITYDSNEQYHNVYALLGKVNRDNFFDGLCILSQCCTDDENILKGWMKDCKMQEELDDDSAIVFVDMSEDKDKPQLMYLKKGNITYQNGRNVGLTEEAWKKFFDENVE